MTKPIGEWTDEELSVEEIQQCHSWDPVAAELAAEVLRLRGQLHGKGGALDAYKQLHAKYEAERQRSERLVAMVEELKGAIHASGALGFCLRCGDTGPFNSQGWCQGCASPSYT